MEVPRDLSLNDPRDLPLYSRAEAARLLGISGSTMEGYVTQKVRDRGLRVSEPVIRIAEGQHGRLSFNNLVEAYVLNLLRSRHDVSMRAVRRAVTYAEREMGVDRLLMRGELRFAEAGDLFWDRYLGELTNLSRGGQLAMRKLVEDGLKRVDWDESTRLPLRLFPQIAGADPSRKTIVIDPNIAFGQPTIEGAGLLTWAVADRIDAGESVEDVATDYGIDTDKLYDALVYEETQ
ncbi:MAG: hypothetical protein CMM84_05230 [Rhodothermaceae bacterium]|nr:hypothetical protein [Rhodothermaceae bacterium]MBC14967.1 hypothetical protein [Rhodothermaceae bacterium]